MKKRIGGQESREIVQIFLEGRSVATMRQYGGAYRKWLRFLKEKGRRTGLVTEELVCSYLIRLEKRGEGEGAVNQFLAMLSFLSELQGKEACTKSQIVCQVKKAIIKRMNNKKKRKMRLSMKKKEMKRERKR